jgi:hypothetical protein
MVTLIMEKSEVDKTLTFEQLDVDPVHGDRTTGNGVRIWTEGEWRTEAFVKAVATLATGRDHTKLRESIRVLGPGPDRQQLYYLEKL